MAARSVAPLAEAQPEAAPIAPTSPESPTSRDEAARADALPRPPLAAGPSALRPEAARQLAAIGIARMPEGTEIRLAPDELGAVRLQVTLEGDVLRVAISAERPETLELMRRHAPDLAAEFRALGYGGAAFSFDRASDERTPDTTARPDPEGSDPEPTHATTDPAARRATSTVGTSLDIRI